MHNTFLLKQSVAVQALVMDARYRWAISFDNDALERRLSNDAGREVKIPRDHLTDSTGIEGQGSLAASEQQVPPVFPFALISYSPFLLPRFE